MNKKEELKIFHYVFGQDITSEIIPFEKPDFLIKTNENRILGVEITELYRDNTDARLKNIDGYALDVLNGTKQIHKKDIPHIKLENIIFEINGNQKQELGIFQEGISFKKRVELLKSIITQKEVRSSEYLLSCNTIDLIINDSSNLFFHEEFEDFYRPFSTLINAKELLASPFREIYLITTRKNKNRIFIPLRGNLFFSDCFAYENLLKTNNDFNQLPMEDIIEILLAALFLSGYQDIKIDIINQKFIIYFGAWEIQYSKNKKHIQDRMLNIDNINLDTMAKHINDFDKNNIEKAKFLVTKRQNVFSALKFSIPVKQTI